MLLLRSALLVAIAPVAARAAAAAAPGVAATSEQVFYFGDPQIGFGKSGYQEDEARFAAAAKAASGAAAVVVAGDLVNVWDNATLTGGFDKVWPSMFDRQKVHLIPGNHVRASPSSKTRPSQRRDSLRAGWLADCRPAAAAAAAAMQDVNSDAPNASSFETQLSHYRSTFGEDFHSFRTAFASFVLINSEALILPHLGLNGKPLDSFLKNETETQWAWMEKELAAAQKASPHVIVVSHHPPFLKATDEKHVYWNWPMGERNRLLGLLSKYGVKNILCGHTHTTTNVTVGGLNIFTVAGTARAFDNNGCGYRVLTINSTDVSSVYVRQTDPALKQCTPSLEHPDFFDNPSLRGTEWADLRWLR